MLYNTIHHEIRNNVNLSLIDWCLLESIYQLSKSERAVYKNWCNASKDYFSYLGSKKTIFNRLAFLEKEGWIVYKKDCNRQLKKTTNKYYDEVLSYILGVQKLPPLKTKEVKVTDKGGKSYPPKEVKVTSNNNIDNNTYNNIKEKDKKENQSSQGIIETNPETLKTETKKQKKKIPQKKKSILDGLEFPKNFSEELREVFSSFVQMRKEIGRPYKSKVSIKTKLNSLSKDIKEYGEEKVYQAIKLSLENQYQGIKVSWLKNYENETKEQTTNNTGSIYDDIERHFGEMYDNGGFEERSNTIDINFEDIESTGSN